MSKLTEAIRKLLAGQLLTPEELDLVDRDNERRERLGLDGGEPRKIGNLANKQRSDEHKPLWLTEAQRIVAEWPMMLRDLKGVANLVRGWCERQTPPVRMKNGKPYLEGTIYRHLLREKEALCVKPYKAIHASAKPRGNTQDEGRARGVER